MKHALVTLLLLTFAVPSLATRPSQDNATFADDGIGMTRVAPAMEDKGTGQRMLSPNYSYIRCAYRLKTTQAAGTDPASDWIWAVHTETPSAWAIVKGHWAGSLPITNMFYTQVNYQRLQEICQFSLQQKHIQATDVIPYAGNGSQSWYYTFWNENPKPPTVKLGKSVFDRMIVFGDSLSDTINLYNATFGAMPQNKSWYLGHFSNGPVWHEYIANNLSHIPSYIWASANSESGDKSFFPSLVSQVDNFFSYRAYANHYNIDNSLFFVFVGGNDFVTGGKSPEQVLENYQQALIRLADGGAKTVAIFRLPDFSIVPAVANRTTQEKSQLADRSVRFNLLLDRLLEDLRQRYPASTFLTLHTDRILDEVLHDSARFGLTDVQNACLNVGNSSLPYIAPQTPSPACVRDNARFMFWDKMHPTTATHRILGDAVWQELGELLSDSH
ncbi:SGNH/GDSL hydrolase family protein [Pantoea sp. 1.19]|uniref:SGNH/GDSL hydrolase family protein n=1 Tax=Pantoea sp. 1.19 TaxID=1925589 RepID=UPI0009F84CEA|nr:SGNH/GDSL hydrolase family protein [Pantoea sp. 1.19]